MRVIFPFGSVMLLIVTLDNAGEPGDIIKRIQTILSGYLKEQINQKKNQREIN